MDESTRKVRRSKWMDLIQQWAASGQTKVEWCRQNGISIKSFYYWQRQLRQEAYCQQVEQNAAVAVPAEVRQTPKPVFAEIPIPEHQCGQVQQPPAFGFQPDAVFQTSCVSIAVSNSASSELLAMIRSVIEHAS